MAAHSYPLLDGYPGLQSGLAHVDLCDLPTPVTRAARAGQELGIDLYVKHDDATAADYGGNKPRKLEFLLARALASGAREVLTFGFAGSNHATATAVYARRLGLGSISMLLAQPPARYVRDNLLISHEAGAELHHYRGVPTLAAGLVRVMASHRLRHGRLPQTIPAGGSSPVGVAGFVNAALELRQQVEQGLLPEPAAIYTAMGSMGTAVGLALGLRAAGLRSQVVAVRVVEDRWAGWKALTKLHSRTGAFLRSIDPTFPTEELRPSALMIREGFLGDGYGHFTRAGADAARLLLETEGVELDGTYSAKAFAALCEDARSGGLAGEPVLFWDTNNSRPLSAAAAAVDRHELPPAFHHYFEGPLQDVGVR
jgi:D-cysteine desulfhydrase